MYALGGWWFCGFGFTVSLGLGVKCLAFVVLVDLGCLACCMVFLCVLVCGLLWYRFSFCVYGGCGGFVGGYSVSLGFCVYDSLGVLCLISAVWFVIWVSVVWLFGFVDLLVRVGYGADCYYKLLIVLVR